MIDIHSHVLPGIDDGAGDLETSIKICRAAYNQGAAQIIATPHYWQGVYQTNWQEVLNYTDNLNRLCRQKGIAVEVLPGMEVRLDVDMPMWLEKGIIGTLNNSGRYLLTELPPQTVPPYTDIVLSKIQALGITPVIAHPERNKAVIDNPQILYSFLEKGILTQITAASLIGAFGSRVQRAAELMLQHNWVHFIASDCHDTEKRPYIFAEGLNAVKQIISAENYKKIAFDNPARAVSSRPIEYNDYKPLKTDNDLLKNRGKSKKGKDIMLKCFAFFSRRFH